MLEQVSKYLFISISNDLRDKNSLIDAGITHVVSISDSGILVFPEHFKYKTTIEVPESKKRANKLTQFLPEACTFIYEAIFQSKGRVVISSANSTSRSIGVLFGFLGFIQGVTVLDDIHLNDFIKSRFSLDQKYVKPVERFLEVSEKVRECLRSPPLIQNFIVNEEGLFEEIGLGKVKKIVSFAVPLVSVVFEFENTNFDELEPNK